MSTEVKDDLLGSLDERIRRISREVLVEHQAREPQSGNSSSADSEDEKLAVTLRRIMAKEFVSIKETALLLNCSDGHIRNLVGKAQKGKALYLAFYLSRSLNLSGSRPDNSGGEQPVLALDHRVCM